MPKPPSDPDPGPAGAPGAMRRTASGPWHLDELAPTVPVAGGPGPSRPLPETKPPTALVELALTRYDGSEGSVRDVLDGTDTDSDINQMDRRLVDVGLRAYLPTLVQERPHGGAFLYRSSETDVLGWVCEKASGVPMQTVMSEIICGVPDPASGPDAVRTVVPSRWLRDSWGRRLRHQVRLRRVTVPGIAAGTRRGGPSTRHHTPTPT